MYSTPVPSWPACAPPDPPPPVRPRGRVRISLFPPLSHACRFTIASDIAPFVNFQVWGCCGCVNTLWEKRSGLAMASVCAARSAAPCEGLVFKAHRRVYHSTLGSRVIKKRREAPPDPPPSAQNPQTGMLTDGLTLSSINAKLIQCCSKMDFGTAHSGTT